jgi:hypothetical protein
MIGSNEKRHRAVEVADPDLSRAGVEIERPLFGNFRSPVRRGKHLDTDFGCAGEDKGSVPELGSTLGEPGNVDGLDTVSCRERTLGQCVTIPKELVKKPDNASLAIGVQKTRWGSHDDTPVSIGLDPVGECGESRICQDFRPACKVQARLRFEVRQLDSDRHAGKIRQKAEPSTADVILTKPILKGAQIRGLLARPRLRPARGVRQFGSAERGAAGFSGLANGGTEILMRGKCLGALSILRLLFRWRVPAEVTPIKID